MKLSYILGVIAVLAIIGSCFFPENGTALIAIAGTVVSGIVGAMKSDHLIDTPVVKGGIDIIKDVITK